MHRDLKLANILLHFPDLDPDDNHYIKNFDFNTQKVVFKIADLGFARKL